MDIHIAYWSFCGSVCERSNFLNIRTKLLASSWIDYVEVRFSTKDGGCDNDICERWYLKMAVGQETKLIDYVKVWRSSPASMESRSNCDPHYSLMRLVQPFFCRRFIRWKHNWYWNTTRSANSRGVRLEREDQNSLISMCVAINRRRPSKSRKNGHVVTAGEALSDEQKLTAISPCSGC